MTISAFKKINKQIADLSYKLERLKIELTDISPSLSGMPPSSEEPDKIGRCVSEIANIENKLFALKNLQDNALKRLSRENAVENCIYLFLAKHYSWRKIAQITDGRVDTIESIKKKCYRYNW